jgi:lactoylglutathione lyase
LARRPAAGLRLPDSDTELVLHTEKRPIETDLLVASEPAAISRFVDAGGKVIARPFEIRIGLCAVIEDPWHNRLVILDSSKGYLRTDAEGNVIERGRLTPACSPRRVRFRVPSVRSAAAGASR